MSQDDVAPPPYAAWRNSADGTEDGRIEIDLNEAACRAAVKFIRWPSDEDPDDQPPAYRDATIPEHVVKLNIVIQVVGSRGDVQPFIALGNELQHDGNRVRIATHDVFGPFVREHGLEFYPIGGDPAELMAYMVKNPGLIPHLGSIRDGELQRKRAMVAEMLHGCWKSCIDDDPQTSAPFVADAIIANPPSFAHVHCAQALGIPVHLMFTMPWTSTRAFPHPLANLKHSNTSSNIANFVSYGLVEWITWQGLGDVVNQWRSTIDLQAIPTTEGPNLLDALKVPFTYCWSPALVPRPRDWAAHIDVCGFFFREPPEYSSSSELETFLSNGPAPVYIGFGSIVIDNAEDFTKMILRAIDAVGCRAIISRGWSHIGGVANDKVFYLDDCPHEWLFQHVAAVVHHGGAGTTACGLRNGQPTVIIPFFGDQYFWGKTVAACGAGPQPIPYRSMNSENLADAIRLALQSATVSAAQDVAFKMQSDSGVRAAVNSFYKNLPFDNMRCHFLDDQPAAWTYNKSLPKAIFLSKAAAQILGSHMRIDTKHLRYHELNRILIENRRWDPVTSTSSACAGIVTDLVKDTGDLVYKPYREYQRSGDNMLPPSQTQTARSATTHSLSTANKEMDGQDIDMLSTTPSKHRTGLQTTGAVASQITKGLGTLLGHYSKGLMVDLPLAATEGLRSVPRLYGDEVRDHGPVRGWKSGALVGGKTFAYDMAEGLSGIFTRPYQGAKEDGAVGAMKGFAKGNLEFMTKTSSGLLGLVAYPGHGITKSIRSAIKSKTRQHAVQARMREGRYLMNLENIKVKRSLVLRAFEALKREEKSATTYSAPKRA